MSASEKADIAAICKEIQEKYSSCDISDALLVLKVPNAGYLPDIVPLPHPKSPSPRLIAPISTAVFVAKSHPQQHQQQQDDPSSHHPSASNIDPETHWTDIPPPGSIAFLQQPSGQISALLGDIVATRLAVRGVAGVIVDGRIRDLPGCGELCSEGHFAVWSKASSTVGTSLEAKPWSVDVPVEVGGRVVVRPGDFAVLDAAERGVVVIPRKKLVELSRLLPELKEADEGVLRDVRAGMGLKEAFARHRGHYVNASS